MILIMADGEHRGATADKNSRIIIAINTKGHGLAATPIRSNAENAGELKKAVSPHKIKTEFRKHYIVVKMLTITGGFKALNSCEALKNAG